VARSGADLVRAAETRGLRVLAGRLLGEPDERRDALRRRWIASRSPSELDGNVQPLVPTA